MSRRTIKLQYNAPVTLSFFFASLAALLLGVEAAAWYYQGRPGDIARWMVRLCNLGTFLLNHSVLLLFHRYLCCTLLTVAAKRCFK